MAVFENAFRDVGHALATPQARILTYALGVFNLWALFRLPVTWRSPDFKEMYEVTEPVVWLYRLLFLAGIVGLILEAWRLGNGPRLPWLSLLPIALILAIVPAIFVASILSIFEDVPQFQDRAIVGDDEYRLYSIASLQDCGELVLARVYDRNPLFASAHRLVGGNCSDEYGARFLSVAYPESPPGHPYIRLDVVPLILAAGGPYQVYAAFDPSSGTSAHGDELAPLLATRGLTAVRYRH